MVRRRSPNLRAAFQTLGQAKAFILARWRKQPYSRGPFARLLADAGIEKHDPIVAAVITGDEVTAPRLNPASWMAVMAAARRSPVTRGTGPEVGGGGRANVI